MPAYPPPRPAQEPLSALGGALLVAGVFEARLALLGLGLMVAGAPWPWRARRVARRLAARWPGWSFERVDEAWRGLSRVDGLRRVRWSLPTDDARQGSFRLRVGGRAPPRRGAWGVLPWPGPPSRAEGQLEQLGRVLAGRIAARLAPGDEVGLDDGWLWWETSGPGEARALVEARAALNGPRPPARAVRVAMGRLTCPTQRAALALGHPGVFERRPEAAELAPRLLAVAGDRGRPRSTRLRALRVAAGAADPAAFIDALLRLVFLVGLAREGPAEGLLVRALDAAELDAQVAAARALERIGGAGALGPLSTARARELVGAGALAEATAHARAAIRSRLSVEPERGTLALADVAGDLAVLGPDQSRSA